MPYAARTNKARSMAQKRPCAFKRGYNSKWRHRRLRHLKREPLCRICKRNDRITPATVVDHIIPHKGSQTLFWDTKNWQSLCESCHNSKSAKEK